MGTMGTTQSVIIPAPWESFDGGSPTVEMSSIVESNPLLSNSKTRETTDSTEPIPDDPPSPRLQPREYKGKPLTNIRDGKTVKIYREPADNRLFSPCQDWSNLV